ncbi:MAG TPA: aminoglycoside phosphotransferase [Pseudonocardia sp.]|jgi:maltokinase|nr:aminoglycoside phosphotransferase [Pseudonocardia sp.]
MTTITDLSPVLLDQIAAWLPQQRWFAAKGRQISSVTVEASVVLREAATPDGPRGDLLVLAVEFADSGPGEHYQLLLGRRGQLPEELTHVAIGADEGSTAYDGIWDPELSGELLADLAAGVHRDWVSFNPEPGEEIPSGLPGRVLSAEQSNTSVVFGDELMLKMFRRVAPGVNPDLELHRALRGVDSKEVATLRASIEGTLGGESCLLGLLQDFAANSADGWSMALISIRDLFAEADLRADEVGGDFAAEAERLGKTVAVTHEELARALGTGTTTGAELADAMRSRLASYLPVVKELAPLADRLNAVFDEVAKLTEPVPTQRIHGDLHLGQALRTPYGWLLIDFEGEPARPLAERRLPEAALRDVSGMLRSFDYAAYHQLAEWDESAFLQIDGPENRLVWRANEWTERNRSAFCDGYAEIAGHDPRDQGILLRAFELDKAVYEAAYETRNRPSWLPVPLRSLRRLLKG